MGRWLLLLLLRLLLLLLLRRRRWRRRSGQLRRWTGGGKRGNGLRDRGRLGGLRHGFRLFNLIFVVIEIARKSHAAKLEGRAVDLGMVAGHHHALLLIEDASEGMPGSASGTRRVLGGGGSRRGSRSSSGSSGGRRRLRGDGNTFGSERCCNSACLGSCRSRTSGVLEFLHVVLSELMMGLFDLSILLAILS